MWRRTRGFKLVWALICSAVIIGCGTDAGSESPTTSALAQVTSENRATRRHMETRTNRSARRIAAANARDGRRAVAVAIPRPSSAAPRPPIVRRWIPFPPQREREMAAYARRHYGIDTFRLRSPKVIVEHYTVSAHAQSAINTFSADVADPELHELPGVCSHFVIDRDGTIYQLVSLGIMCRHTVGLNYTAIGIEHAGFKASDILSNRAELRASQSLTRWLACRYGISVANVIGHNESLTSAYHRERVSRLRSQTHGDWTRAEMDVYRRRLGPLRC